LAAVLSLKVKAGDNSSKSLSSLIRSEKYGNLKYGIKLPAENNGFSMESICFYFRSFLLKKWSGTF